MFLFGTPGNASLGEVIYRHLNGYAITGQNTDIVHAKLSRNVCGHDMTVGKLYLEGGIGQRLNHNTLKFNHIILWQKNPSLFLIFATDRLLTDLYLG